MSAGRKGGERSRRVGQCFGLPVGCAIHCLHSQLNTVDSTHTPSPARACGRTGAFGSASASAGDVCLQRGARSSFLLSKIIRQRKNEV